MKTLTRSLILTGFFLLSSTFFSTITPKDNSRKKQTVDYNQINWLPCSDPTQSNRPPREFYLGEFTRDDPTELNKYVRAFYEHRQKTGKTEYPDVNGDGKVYARASLDK